MLGCVQIEANETEICHEFRVLHSNYALKSEKAMIPRQPVPVILMEAGVRTLKTFRWGLFPYWAKDSIWADGHDVYYKRAFDRIMKKQRCVIPCSAFFGSKELDQRKKTRIPVRFTLNTHQIFAIAGLYDEWITPKGERIYTCTFVTTPVNRVTAPYMNRMPLILEDDAMIQLWLDKGMQDKKMLKSLILPLSEYKLEIEETSSWPESGSAPISRNQRRYRLWGQVKE